MNIQNIKKGDKFTVNGIPLIASADAHYNVEEECWIVYDTNNNGWFEEDIDINSKLN